MTVTLTREFDALKTRLKSTWEAGDYATFAKPMEAGSIEFFDRLGIEPGIKFLDVGCGAGQLTIPAALRGIDVTAIDLAQNLLDVANARAQAHGLKLDIRQVDAEAIPFEDDSFDVVMSFIGAMFAPRPELVASEMVRVCRSDGRIIMGNWTPTGFVGQMFKLVGQHVSPANFPSPVLWGVEDEVRARLSDKVSDLKTTKRSFPFRYPFGPSEVADFFIRNYGPTVKANAALEGEAREAFRNDLIGHWSAANLATDGTTAVDAEILEVIATK
jgi:SAM-dependent methyltransferase